MAKTTHTIRIVDARQSKHPNFWRVLAIWAVVPGSVFWPGLITGSAAMQWAGFVLLMVFTMLAIGRWFDEYKTPTEARKRIEEIEANNG